MTFEASAPAVALLMNLFWKSTLLFLAAGVAVLVLRRAAAAWRHLAWTAYLGGLLLLPPLAALLPPWRMPAPPVRSLARSPASVLPSAPAPTPAASPASLHRVPTTAFPAETVTAAPTPRPAPVPLPWQAWALGAWLLGALVFSARVGLALAVVARLGRRSEAAGPPLADTFSGLCREAGVRSPVTLRVLPGPDAVPPMTWGLLRPVVLLPGAAAEWPPDLVRSVLLHELAHVRRGDWLVQMLAEGVCAVYWTQPLAWWALRRLRLEAEGACDDAVLAAGLPAAEYAAHLLAVVRRLAGHPGTTPAAVPMAQPSQLGSRLRALLDVRRRRAQRSPAAVAASAALAGVVVAPLSAARLTPAPEAAYRLVETGTHASIAVDVPRRPAPLPAPVPSTGAGIPTLRPAFREPATETRALAAASTAPAGPDRTALRPDGPPAAPAPPAGETRWGAARDGIQTGIRFLAARGEYRPGDTFSVEVRLRNTGREPLTLRLNAIRDYTTFLSDERLLRLDTLTGEPVTVTLGPGEERAVPGVPYTGRLGRWSGNGNAATDQASASHLLPLFPGRYRLQVAAPLQVRDAQDPARGSVLPARPGTLELRVLPARGERPPALLSATRREPAGRIAWGPVRQGLQVGLSFSGGRSGWAAGETVRLETWVRNATDQARTLGFFVSPHEYLDEPPTLIGPDGSTRTPFFARFTIPVWNLQTVKLAPGEAVLLGHPVLELAEEEPARTQTTPVLAVSPGRYRLRQSAFLCPGGTLDLGLESGSLPLEVVPAAGAAATGRDQGGDR